MIEFKGEPVGYQALIERYKLNVIPHHRKSYTTSQSREKSTRSDHQEIYQYPKNYGIKVLEDQIQHIEFAIKYDGVNLQILHKVFKHVEEKLIIQHIKKHPTSKYARIIWYLYEYLTGIQLPIENADSGNYVDLLDEKKYFCSTPIKKRRYRVNDNLLGNQFFCPIVRKTNFLTEYIKKNLDQKTVRLLKKYDPNIIARANNYLYTKETKSSYEIEREQPSQRRITKFIHLLQRAQNITKISKEMLIDLQNIIVDPRFQDVDYRIVQNYVGENIGPYEQKLHYISPKPSDVDDLMSGLLESLDRMVSANIHPIIIAAAITFGFVYIHPFEDGNGRIHRFLIHAILAQQGFTPQGTIFPVSAVILKNIKKYDEILESFSTPLLDSITDFYLSNEGELTVKQNTKVFYQYIDYTSCAEYLFSCIEETIDTDFQQELEYLVCYDKTKKEIQEIIDMPDKYIDLIIKFVTQNNGKLSTKKRECYFSKLTEKEIEDITTTIEKYMS